LPSEQHDGEMAGVVEIVDIVVTVLETELPLLPTEGSLLGG
jgi:hypothetical protein